MAPSPHRETLERAGGLVVLGRAEPDPRDRLAAAGGNAAAVASKGARLPAPFGCAISFDSSDGSAMGQLLVRNLDDAVVERLKRQAEARRISLEQLLREILSRAAGPSRKELVAEMDRIRAMTPGKLARSSTDLIREDRDRR